MNFIRSNGFVAALALAWALAVGAGLRILVRYENTPGPAAIPASGRWPEQSAIRRDPGRATLVMLAHPRCPCTRASVAELARLMARYPDRVTAHVLFVLPGASGSSPSAMAEPSSPGASGSSPGGDWTDTDLWRRAEAIPGVQVRRDPGGAEARRCFGGATSGQTFLYDAQGRLVFRGGITVARGHEGDNPGSEAVAALLDGKAPAAPISTPVFGCALFDQTAEAGEVTEQ